MKNNQPPLNQDALDHIATVVFGCTIEEWNEHIEYEKRQLLAPYVRIISTYLAAALPEVTTVEELEALPAGSLVKSGGREFYKTSYIEYPWVLPYGVDRFGSEYLAKHSKVTVTHRPEKDDA